MIRGRANPCISDEPMDCAQRKQAVFRTIKLNRSDVYCGKIISLVNPVLLAKKQNNRIGKSAVINKVTDSLHGLRPSMTSSYAGLRSPCCSKVASGVVSSNGSS